ncbi:MAG: alpha/beta hydrolase [Candidatus Omnitrophica bacterium]|nr:alpha/beta hydrolase [Candidatus Omnitrophota bacterium]
MGHTEFTFINRGRDSLAVLLPGWATDWRIFDRLDIEYDYLVPGRIDPDGFSESLERCLGQKKATLIGWSFGGVLGARFLARYPGSVSQAVFASVKERYPAAQTEKMKTYLARNRGAALKGFFRRCFRGHKAGDIHWFNTRLLDPYLKHADPGELTGQLDFLHQNPLPVDELKRHGHKMTFVAGAEDAVIPPEETLALKRIFPKARFVKLKNTGHASFLDPGFKYLLDGHNG